MDAIGERGGIGESPPIQKDIEVGVPCQDGRSAGAHQRLLKKSAGEVRVRPTIHGKRERRVRAAPMPFTFKAKSGIG